MIALCLLPLYILVNLYVFRWLMRWMAACHPILHGLRLSLAVGAVYAFFALSMLAGFLMPPGPAGRLMKRIGNYWLGVTLYMVLAVVIADVIRLVLRRYSWIDQAWLCSRRMFVFGGALCILVIAGISLYGVLNVRAIRTAGYEIEVRKDGGRLDSLRVVLAADLHLGYNIGCARMERMVGKINALDPDLVVIAGDIFDNEYEALEDPERLSAILRGIRSRYGVYACYGNHDIEEKILAGFTFGGKSKEKVSDPEMDEFLERSDIRLLRDEYVLIDDSFYLYGRPDAKRPGRGIDVRKTPEEITEGLDLTKPVLVIDHQPRELQELADAGVDVDLSGHTHDGQLFPANLISGLVWENSCGYLQKDSMHSIVTSGVGVFGPDMRVGTHAEICDIRIRFTGPSGE